MKLILQFAVILYICAINNAVYDDRKNYLSLRADNERKPGTRGAKHKNNVNLQSSIKNKHVKDILEQAYYKDVMLSNKKKILYKHMNDQQTLINNENIGIYSKPNVKHKDLDHNMAATPTPIKEFLKEIIPLQHAVITQHNGESRQYFKNTPNFFRIGQLNEIFDKVKPQNRQNDLLVRYVHSPAEKNYYYQDINEAKTDANVIITAKIYSQEIKDIKAIDRVAVSDREKKRFQIDSTINLLENVRRRAQSDFSSLSSSSDEIIKWKEQFKEQHMKKKYEALKSSKPAGDSVNMVAARPWGVPCGDPNQHDLPWGTCMLNSECEPEYRVYRGDNFCGRSEFVCCSIQLNDNDMYQGFDISFDSKSLSTDSEDRKENNKDSKEKRKKRKERDRKKRKKGRKKRVAKIKKSIKKIVTEMKELLDKQFKNGTKQRKQKTRLLKKFIKKLKQQYKKDREAIADIHEEEMIRIDAALQKKLNELMEMNTNFIKNITFREIVVNGAMNKKGARMLLEAYPDLDPYLHKVARKSRKTRKSGGISEVHFDENAEYDLEYGYLYFE